MVFVSSFWTSESCGKPTTLLHTKPGNIHAQVRRFDKKPDIAEVVHDISVFFESASKPTPIIKRQRDKQNVHRSQARGP